MNNKNRGFTLIELLVVIAIIAILAECIYQDPESTRFNYQYCSLSPDRYAHFKHANMMNMLFLDGHVESATPSRFVEATKKHGTAPASWEIMYSYGTKETLMF